MQTAALALAKNDHALIPLAVGVGQVATFSILAGSVAIPSL